MHVLKKWLEQMLQPTHGRRDEKGAGWLRQLAPFISFVTLAYFIRGKPNPAQAIMFLCISLVPMEIFQTKDC